MRRSKDRLPEGSLVAQPLKMGITFYCYKCEGVATTRTCPHGTEDQLQISGTRLREMFANNEKIPKEFSRPEVVKVLREYYASDEGLRSAS
jgi:sulfate adenylyltransferase